MSFALTWDAMVEERKSVTRRLGWRDLKPGEVVLAVSKVMGLKPGQQADKLYPIGIDDVRTERLDAITDEDVAREGFPGMSAAAFVEMFCQHQRGVRPDTMVQRIAFHRVRERTFSQPAPEETDDVDVVKCWCGVVGPHDEMFSIVLPGCGGTGFVDCLCGGDQCVCHNHGEVECDGCDECNGDDEGYARDMGDEVWP